MEQRVKTLSLEEREKLVQHGAIVAEMYDRVAVLHQYVQPNGFVRAREKWVGGKRTLEFTCSP